MCLPTKPVAPVMNTFRLPRALCLALSLVLALLGDARFGEGRHLGEHLAAGFDQARRQRGAGAFAQPHVHEEHGLQRQLVEHQLVAGLDAHVGGDHVAAALGAEAGGNHGRGAGDESVDDYRHAVGSGAEDDAGQAADLEAADLGRARRGRHACPAGWCGWPRRMTSRLCLQGLGADAGAAADAVQQVGSGENREDGAAGGGVGDAHVAGAEQVGAVGDLGLGDFDAGFDAGDGLLAGHGRSFDHVGGAGADLFVDHARDVNDGRDAHVDDAHLGARMPRQHVDAGAAGREVGDHLRRDFLRESADALGGDTVVAGHDDDDFFGDLGNRLAAGCRPS